MTDIYPDAARRAIETRRIAIKPAPLLLSRLTLDDEIILKLNDERIIYCHKFLRYVPKNEYLQIKTAIAYKKTPPLEGDKEPEAFDAILVEGYKRLFLYPLKNIRAVYITSLTASEIGLIKLTAEKTALFKEYVIGRGERKRKNKDIASLVMSLE